MENVHFTLSLLMFDLLIVVSGLYRLPLTLPLNVGHSPALGFRILPKSLSGLEAVAPTARLRFEGPGSTPVNRLRYAMTSRSSPALAFTAAMCDVFSSVMD